MSEPTKTQFAILANYYDDPDVVLTTSKRPTSISRLEQDGYITPSDDADGYMLTDLGRKYIKRFKRQVEDRDLEHMLAYQREWVALHKLNPAIPDDRRLMVDMILHDQSEFVRRAIIGTVRLRRTFTKNDWNRLAHSDGRYVRKAAAMHADPTEFADESEAGIVERVVECCRKKGKEIPHELVARWYANGNTGAVEAMTQQDLDVALKDGNTAFVVPLAMSHAGMFDMKRIARVCDLADEKEGAEAEVLNVAANSLLENVDHLPESLIRRYADMWQIRWRLHEYREAYRRFMEKADMFDDPDCGFAREQQRLALSSLR